MPVAVEITAGETSGYAGFEPLMAAQGPKSHPLIADWGYDADHIRKTMESGKTATVIPMRKNRKNQVPVNGYIYALRNRIERCFNRLKNTRRMATRYNETLESYRGFVSVVAIRLWIRALVNRT